MDEFMSLSSGATSTAGSGRTPQLPLINRIALHAVTRPARRACWVGPGWCRAATGVLAYRGQCRQGGHRLQLQAGCPGGQGPAPLMPMQSKAMSPTQSRTPGAAACARSGRGLLANAQPLYGQLGAAMMFPAAPRRPSIATPPATTASTRTQLQAARQARAHACHSRGTGCQGGSCRPPGWPPPARAGWCWGQRRRAP